MITLSANRSKIIVKDVSNMIIQYRSAISPKIQRRLVTLGCKEG